MQKHSVSGNPRAEEYLVRLKAETYEARRSGLPAPRSWQDAVVRYLEEFADKRSIADDKDHLRKLDPYLRARRLDQINMNAHLALHPRSTRAGQGGECDHQPRLGDRASNVECRASGLELAATGAEGANALGTEAADSISDARGGRPLDREFAEHLRAVVRFALATGCRMSEILHLEWQRVDFGRRVAWLDPGTTKSGEGRGIPLNNDAVLALRDVEGIHEAWCFTYQGKRMDEVGSAWERSLSGPESRTFDSTTCGIRGPVGT